MRARLRIDPAAIRHNITTLQALVSPARVAAVVKANAYGHGLLHVARAAEDVAARLCVFTLDEAIALRDSGITAAVHVLGPIDPNDLDAAHAAGVQITLWDRGTYAAQVASIARRRRARIDVQAKIDTGVTRLGVGWRDAPAAVERWRATPEYNLCGVYSHLAAAEELESAFTLEQLARFERAVAGVPATVERHLAASAAAMLYPQTRLDCVRAGIAVYGIWPSADTQAALAPHNVVLRPALSWLTDIVLVHDVPAGTSVGYGCAWTTERASRIAVVPIGYAEGIPRRAGGRASVLVDGRRAPLVGRVCMDIAFIDVTDVPGAHAGSTVTLIGSDGGERITAEDWGGWCETIGYEIVARLPESLVRETAVAPETLHER